MQNSRKYNGCVSSKIQATTGHYNQEKKMAVLAPRTVQIYQSNFLGKIKNNLRSPDSRDSSFSVLAFFWAGTYLTF